MAVLLCRSDGKPFPLPQSEMKNLPRIVINYEPLPNHLSHQGRVISARSDTHYACTEEPRERIFKNTYERRHIQLTQCGFHSPVSKPYKDMGTVVMDDGKLIMESLGQAKDENQKKVPIVKKVENDSILPQPASMISPYRVKFHPRKSSKFPTELLDLNQRVTQGYTQLDLMRKGRGLFRLLDEDKKMKQLKEQKRAQQDQDAIMNQWKEADVASDITVAEDGRLLRQESVSCDESHDELSLEATNFKILSDQLNDLDLSTRSDGGCVVTEVVERWYRKLCVLVWILETMQRESPNYSIPLAKCWYLGSPWVDEATGQKIYEAHKMKIKKWQELYIETKLQGDYKTVNNKGHSVIGFCVPPTVGSRLSRFARQDLSGSDKHRMNSKSVEKFGFSRFEEEKMKKQRKLTVSQMEKLVTMLNEEFNYSQKKSRNRINALRKNSRFKNQTSIKKAWQVPPQPVSLDMNFMLAKLSDSKEERKMIVHEQLMAMERDREMAIQQRLKSLHISGNLWKDLKIMRKGVKIETTDMAKRRILMNYDWYQELNSMLPFEVTSDRYCRQLMETLCEISHYMCSVGPEKMSSKKLIQVLASLRPWELQAPDIQSAVEFMIERVVYISKDDYAKWLEQHILASGVKSVGIGSSSGKKHTLTHTLTK